MPDDVLDVAVAVGLGLRARLAVGSVVLDRREVARFQRSSVDKLRDYLSENGYLDARPARATEDIRLAMIGALAAEASFSSEAVAEVDYLLKIVSRSSVSSGSRATGGAAAQSLS